jgi:26S proteasome regulatory subunit N11
MEVMGLMLGQFVDEYTITCVDVFAMPQHGTGACCACVCDMSDLCWVHIGVSVEAVDPVFQSKMLDMLKQTGRLEMVVGEQSTADAVCLYMIGDY